MKTKTILILGILVLLIAGGIAYYIYSNEKELKVSLATVHESELNQNVTATGYVQPVDKVDVGTQVSGVIEKILVDFNSHVKKGDLLAELDPSSLLERLSQANADLAAQKSALVYAQQNFDRTKQLYEQKAATQASFQDATNKLTSAKSALVNSKANVQQAQVNLGYSKIYSPIDGIVLNRAVDQGQTVAASFSTPTLFTIAKDLKKMQVEANVDEADIGSVKLGQLVTFTVDSYTDDVFSGVVSQIRLQPTVVSSVVTYTAIITAPNPDEKLYPGMTANVTIVTHSEKGLVIPREAIKLKPDAEALKMMGVSSSEVQHDQGSHGAHGSQVWIKTGATYHTQAVETGMNDGVNMIVTKGLNSGDTVLLTALAVKKEKKSEKVAANPFMPKRPSRKK